MTAVRQIRRQPRRSGVLLAAGILLAVTMLFTVRGTGRALAVSSGDPYSVPAVVDTNPDPNIVETSIVAEEATVDIGAGVMAHVQTFNGTIPGPEFRLKVGDTVIVHFQNELDEVTGIHWHGIELDNASDGTPLTQNQVPPGGKFIYKFKVTRPGIFWYHPHHHASTNQVFKGLYGSILVTDAHEAALQANGVLPPESDTRTLALNDITVCKAPGSNDAETYNTDPSKGPVLPHVSGSPLPAQPSPFPVQLCETNAFDDEGNPRGPFAAGDVPNVQSAGTSGRVNEGQTVLTNGKNVGGREGTPDHPGGLAAGAATMDVKAGQGLRLRLGNESVVRFFRLRLTSDSGALIPLVRVGGQGGFLDSARIEGGKIGNFDTKYDRGELLLDPGDRADVVVAVPPDATGILTLWEEDFARTGQGFADIPTVPVAHFKVSGTAASTYTIGDGTPLLTAIGASVEQLGPPTGTLLDPATFSPAKPGLKDQNIQLTQGSNALGVNGIKGDHEFAGDYRDTPRPGSARYAKLGDVLELTVTNTTGAHHPFHLHGFSIQPLVLLDASGATVFTYAPEFRDNVDVPPKLTLKFRVRLDDRPLMDGVTPGGGIGRWVFHCHIFFHAVFGMISEFDVVAPNGNERPYVNTDTVQADANEGQTATATGTFKDPDGDPVTLSASLGTVTDKGGGTWSWSYPTTDGPDESRLVYITATDAGGQKDQITFFLNETNVAPKVNISSPTAGQVLQAGNPVTVTAPFTDDGTGDTHTCSIDWGDGVVGPGTVDEASGSGKCTGTHTYTLGGHKTINVSVADDDGGSASASVLIQLNGPPACSLVQASPRLITSSNHKLQTVSLSLAPDPDGDPVTQSITGVTQDEPVNGTGDGDVAPDAFLIAGQPNKVSLRAERAGTGDGRVYRIAFRAVDNHGGSCTGTAKVMVPRQGDTAIDSGGSFNSL